MQVRNFPPDVGRNAGVAMAPSQEVPADVVGGDPNEDHDHLEVRIEGALGDFRKLFHSGCITRRSGATFGGWGTFLPTERRQPSQLAPAGAARIARLPAPPPPNGNASRHTNRTAPRILELVSVPEGLAPELPSASDEQERHVGARGPLHGVHMGGSVGLGQGKKVKQSDFVKGSAGPSIPVKKYPPPPGANAGRHTQSTGKLSIKLKLPGPNPIDNCPEPHRNVKEDDFRRSLDVSPVFTPTTIRRALMTEFIPLEDVLRPLSPWKLRIPKGIVKSGEIGTAAASVLVHGVPQGKSARTDRGRPGRDVAGDRHGYLHVGEQKKDMLPVQDVVGSHPSLRNADERVNATSAHREDSLVPGKVRPVNARAAVGKATVAAKGHDNRKSMNIARQVETQEGEEAAGLDAKHGRKKSEAVNVDRFSGMTGIVGVEKGGKMKEKSGSLRTDEKTDKLRTSMVEVGKGRKQADAGGLMAKAEEEKAGEFFVERGVDATRVDACQAEVKRMKSVNAGRGLLRSSNGATVPAGIEQRLEGRARSSRDLHVETELARGTHTPSEFGSEDEQPPHAGKRKKPSGSTTAIGVKQGGAAGIGTVVLKRGEAEQQRNGDHANRSGGGGGAVARRSSQALNADPAAGREGQGPGVKRVQRSPTSVTASKAKGKLSSQGFDGGASKVVGKPQCSKSPLPSGRVGSQPQLESAGAALPSEFASASDVVPGASVPNQESVPVLQQPKLFIDNWVSCDKCQKWRLLPSTVIVDENSKWFCRMNTWSPHLASCKRGQEETANAVLDMENVASAEERKRVLDTLAPDYVPPLVVGPPPAPVAPLPAPPPPPPPSMATEAGTGTGRQSAATKLGASLQPQAKKGLAKRVVVDESGMEGGAQRLKSLNQVSFSKKWVPPGTNSASARDGVEGKGINRKAGSQGGARLEKRDATKAGIAEREGEFKKKKGMVEEQVKGTTLLNAAAVSQGDLPSDGVRGNDVEKKRVKGVPGVKEDDKVGVKESGTAKRGRLTETASEGDDDADGFGPPSKKKKSGSGRPVVMRDADRQGAEGELRIGAGGTNKRLNSDAAAKRDTSGGGLGNGYDKRKGMVSGSEREHEGKREAPALAKQKGPSAGSSKLEEKRRQERHRDGVGRSVAGKETGARGGSAAVEPCVERPRGQHTDGKPAENRDRRLERTGVPLKKVDDRREPGARDPVRKGISGNATEEGRKDGTGAQPSNMLLAISEEAKGEHGRKAREGRAGSHVKLVEGECMRPAEAVGFEKGRESPAGRGHGGTVKNGRDTSSESLSGGDEYVSAEDAGKDASPMESTLSSPADSRQGDGKEEKEKAAGGPFPVNLSQELAEEAGVEAHAHARLSSPALPRVGRVSPGHAHAPGFRSRSPSEERLPHLDVARANSLRADDRSYSPEASRERERDRERGEHFSRSLPYRGGYYEEPVARSRYYGGDRYGRSCSRERYRDHGDREHGYRSRDRGDRDRDRDGGRDREQQRERVRDCDRVREESGSSRPTWERDRERARDQERGSERDRGRESGWERHGDWGRSTSREPRRERPLVSSAAAKLDAGSAAAAVGPSDDTPLLKAKSSHGEKVLSPVEGPIIGLTNCGPLHDDNTAPGTKEEQGVVGVVAAPTHVNPSPLAPAPLTQEREGAARVVPPLPSSAGPTPGVAASDFVKWLKEAKDIKRRADKQVGTKLGRQLYMDSAFKFLRCAATKPELLDQTAAVFEFCAQQDRDPSAIALALRCAAVTRTQSFLAHMGDAVDILPGVGRPSPSAANAAVATAPAAVKDGCSPSSSSASDVDNLITQAGLLGHERTKSAPSDVHRSSAAAQPNAVATMTIPVASNCVHNVDDKKGTVAMIAWKKATAATAVIADLLEKTKTEVAVGTGHPEDVALMENRMQLLSRVGADMGFGSIETNVLYAQQALDMIDI